MHKIKNGVKTSKNIITKFNALVCKNRHYSSVTVFAKSSVLQAIVFHASVLSLFLSNILFNQMSHFEPFLEISTQQLLSRLGFFKFFFLTTGRVPSLAAWEAGSVRFQSFLAFIVANNGNALAPIRDIRGNLLWHDLIKGQHILKTASVHSTDDKRHLCRQPWMKCLSVASDSSLTVYLILSAEKLRFVSQKRMFGSFFFVFLNSHLVQLI